jgi:hypothetical protein
MWKYLLATLFILHGLIHALGFAATWQIGSISAVSSTPSLIGGLSAGAAPGGGEAESAAVCDS